MKMTRLVLALSIAGAVMAGLPRSTVADYAAPHAELVGPPTTVAFWGMDNGIRSDKYLKPSGTVNAEWLLIPNPVSANPGLGVEIIDPGTNSVGYPAGNAAFGECLYFPATNLTAFGTPANSALTGFDKSWVTYKGWAKEIPQSGANRILLDHWGVFVFYITDTGYRLLTFDGLDGNLNTTVPVTGTPGWAATNWNHYELRFEGGGGNPTVKVLINDVLEASYTYSAIGTSSKNRHYYGARYTGSDYFKGYMDDCVIIYNNTQVPAEDHSYNDFCNLWLLDAAAGETNGTLDIDLDGMNNLEEWAYGGNPYAQDAELAPQITADESGLQVIHNRLRTQLDNNLTNTVSTSTDLMAGFVDFDDGDPDKTESVTIEDPFFETVTNHVATGTAAEQFLNYSLEVGPQSVTPVVIPCAYAIPLAATTPTIDGVLSAGEYDDAHYVDMKWPEIGTNGCGHYKYQEPTHVDFRVEKYTKWDATWMYVLFDVTDDTNHFTEVFGTYPRDHMGFAINPLLLGTTSSEIVFNQLAIRITNGVMDTVVDPVFNSDLFPDNAVYNSSTNGVGGYTIEIAFKWSDLGVVPVQGQKHGIALLAIDDDDGTAGNPTGMTAGTDTFLYDTGSPNQQVITTPSDYSVVQLGPEL